MKRSFALGCLLTTIVFGGCTTPKTYSLPSQDEFQGYKIIDGVDKDTIAVDVRKDEKIAVLIRDIATTSYSYLEPRYMNSMVTYEGKSKCCTPTSQLIGASGNVVYKFSFTGLGKTTILIIARHKGELTTANSFDDDHPVTINVNVKD